MVLYFLAMNAGTFAHTCMLMRGSCSTLHARTIHMHEHAHAELLHKDWSGSKNSIVIKLVNRKCSYEYSSIRRYRT